MTNRLTKKQIKAYRDGVLKAQGGICPLCERVILQENATLDHDHGTGHCRMVLHTGCNQVEGQILQRASRTGAPPDRFLQNLLDYWEEDFTGNPLHPRGTRAQRSEITKLRYQLKRAKRKQTKDRLREKIAAVMRSER